MCENGCMTFGMAELKLIEQLEDRLRRIEEQLKNHEMIFVEKVI